ncbi:MAG: ABC transporter permease [Lachnospiraceae bacterium]|nr:ABC transporter permease [Lachnospiraceae bacterium]
MEELLRIPLEIYRDREVFMTLVKNDFQARFAGSYLGRFWAYVQPVITILLYWFVFQIGLRSGDVSDHPFILFLMAGLVPWFYFSEALVGATGSLIEYNYLVKKVVFNVGFLPVLKVLSSLFVHGFFVAIVVILSLIYGYGFDWYLLQIIYYGFCLAFFVLGISHITAACTVFFKDMTQIVNIFLTIGIWLTPIMWNPQMTMPASLQKLFEVNPVYYIVDGYRDALLDKMWFWEKPEWSIYFWCLTIVIYVLGVKMFNRLKGHFPDVL